MLARHPQRLSHLIAGGAHADGITASPASRREAELFRTEGTAPFITALEHQGPLPRWMRTVMQGADPHALAALSTALAGRGSVLEALAGTPVPVLLLAGDRDPQLAAIRRTAAGLPAATLIELSGCGHLDAFVRTDLTLPAVRSFLAGRPVLPG